LGSHDEAGWIGNAIFELIPMKNTLERARSLPAGATVSVTASPDKGMSATIDLALELARWGLNVIPHISARATKTKLELAGIVDELHRANITHVFVVGGDATEPGEFFDAMELLTALDSLGHPFQRIGVTGYPEGHPSITDAQLLAALVDKTQYASYLATQMCFDAAAIESWVHTVRAAGVELPIWLGVPGAVDAGRLLTIGARIGVGESLRYLRKNRAITKVIRGGTSATDGLLDTLDPMSADLGLSGLHVFTFNAVADTVAWWEHRSQVDGDS
jgi:methylenetetrahydrofolate reductase (NADPH)